MRLRGLIVKTYSTKKSDIVPEWHLIDAEGKTLGRLATEVAQLLKGKHKPNYVSYLDTGDYVVIVNAEKVLVTGNKAEKKIYYRHSLYPGGLKSVNYRRMLQEHPTRIIEHAVKGMLPHNRLGAAMYKKLKVYKGPNHPHEAQLKGE